MSNKSNVWFAIPSARPADELIKIVEIWQDRGYRVAIQRDPQAGLIRTDKNDPHSFVVERSYLGYAEAVNDLCKTILHRYPDVAWIVTGGDDVLPDPNKSPNEIADWCTTNFSGTYGIMQPTGDKYMIDASGRGAADRVCVSPWMGREWIKRAYGGNGPLWSEYFHFFVDEELKEVAESQGVLWQRPDLIQKHNHWTREGRQRPAYLAKAQADWEKAKNLFETRKAAGFPGSAPCA